MSCSCPNHDRGPSRRELLKMGATGLLTGFLGLGLTTKFFLEEAYGMTPVSPLYDACIQIYYMGGPSQWETFDPKPGSIYYLGSDPATPQFAAMDLRTPSGVANDIYGRPIQVSSCFPNLTRLVASDPAIGLGLVRSMYMPGDMTHSQAQRMTNAFWQTAVAEDYPSCPSVMAYFMKGRSPIGIDSVYVNPSSYFHGDQANSNKGGACPTAFEADAGGSVQYLTYPTNTNQARYLKRKSITDAVNATFLPTRPDSNVSAWNAALNQAYSVTQTPAALNAFDMSGVPLLPTANVGGFGGPAKIGNLDPVQGLTLAMRLVEAGVPYVTCGCTNNDTHMNNTMNTTINWANFTDPALSQLATTLKAAKNPDGSPKRTLVVLGGEWGRTPTTTAKNSSGVRRDGRDHWPEGFTWAMLSINQTAFKTTAVGETGPDGTWTGENGLLVDPIYPGAFGGLLYRAMGYPVASTPAYDVPTADGSLKPPVDPNMASPTSTSRGGSTWLMQQFGLA